MDPAGAGSCRLFLPCEFLCACLPAMQPAIRNHLLLQHLSSRYRFPCCTVYRLIPIMIGTSSHLCICFSPLASYYIITITIQYTRISNIQFTYHSTIYYYTNHVLPSNKSSQSVICQEPISTVPFSLSISTTISNLTK